MRRWAALVVVLAVDWAALHDIVKGNEPTLWMEHTWLLASPPVLVMLGLLARRNGVRPELR